MDNFWKNSLAGSSACLIATGTLNPLEVIKIQIQSNSHDSRGLVRTARRLLEVEGYWHGLMKPGLAASCSRELLYSSLRFSIYPHLRTLIRSDSHHLGFAAFSEKFGAGLIAGAVGSSLANPADLLKIRMQSEPGKVGADGRFVRGTHAGQMRTYRTTLEALKAIVKTEGIRGLYRGVSATCIRSSLLTAGQMSSYDHSKQLIKASGFLSEGIPLHCISSVFSGLVAATCCAPADRIKTLMIVRSKDLPNNLSFKQSVQHIFKTEGLIGFYRGWTPSYFRLAPHFIISLPLNEQFRKLLGLEAF